MTMDNSPEYYYSINKEYGPIEFKEKGSGFISYLFPASEKPVAESILAGLRKKYHDATHVCYAYRIGRGREVYFRLNDDGEPSGTAGIPIYNEIKGRDYFNVLTAVVRYYGGIKLGVGGLTRAYGHSAKLVLDISKKIEIIIQSKAELMFPYDFLGEVMQIINRHAITITAREFKSSGVSMRLDIPTAHIKTIEKLISDRSFGKVQLIITQA